MRHTITFIYFYILSLALADTALADDDTTAASTVDSLDDSRLIKESHSHRERQWLLNFQPIGFATDFQQGGLQSSMQADYMLERFLWIGVSGEWTRIGFLVAESDPPQYHHIKQGKFLARAGLGGSGRFVGAFGIIGFGANITSEDVSNFDVPESVWLSKGLSVVAGGDLTFTVHPNLSLGLETKVCWDFQVWGEPYSDRLLSFVIASQFRVHL